MTNKPLSKAPDFKLPDQEGRIHQLSDYKGQYVVLYFYPKDMTSGCTLEAQHFRDEMDVFKSKNVQVIGISPDSIKSHKKFAEKEGLNFILLSDESKEVAQKYGVWVEKSMYGRKYMGVQRDTFLIDPQGKILKHYSKVKPGEHVQEVLKDIEALS